MTRSTSPDAIRARRHRVRRGAGLVYFGHWLHLKDLSAALRANRRLDPGATHEEVDAALWQMVGDYIERWIGKK
jgi:hypothetical protein